MRARIPSDVVFVGDAKRGDIGSTAARQAVALYDGLGFDAITANPYLGSEAIEPLLSRGDRFAYLLCRTSNPGAGELQGLEVAPDQAMAAPAEPLYARVARRAQAWGPGGTVGLVVGATAPVEMELIRGIAPGLALLVPGVGAQGGEVEPVMRSGPAVAAPAGGRAGGGLLVNVSRGISGAAGKAAVGDVEDALATAAREWSVRLGVAGTTDGGSVR
jgi:orotidine-5'-phosphate decarboxylase